MDETTLLSAVITASASGATQVVAAVAGRRIRVVGYTYRVNAAVNVKWQSGSTDLTGLLYNGGAGEGDSPFANEQSWLFQTAVGAALNINLSAAVAVGGHVQYHLAA